MYIESGILHNHGSDNDEPNSKDNSEIALHWSLLRASTVFFFCLSKGKRAGTKSDNSNEDRCESGILHNHCNDNDESNWNDNSEIALHWSLLRASTVFFFFLSKGKRAGTKSDIWNEGRCESGILHNLCSDNDEPNSKDNSDIALHWSLLRASTFFFSASPRGNVQVPNLTFRTKAGVKVVFCTIIVMTTTNLIRRTTLK